MAAESASSLLRLGAGLYPLLADDLKLVAGFA
jgi:hypothetical protein